MNKLEHDGGWKNGVSAFFHMHRVSKQNMGKGFCRHDSMECAGVADVSREHECCIFIVNGNILAWLHGGLRSGLLSQMRDAREYDRSRGHPERHTVPE